MSSEIQPTGPTGSERKVAGFEVCVFLTNLRRVDLVVEHDHRAQTPGRLASRNLDRGQQVGRTIGARERGVAHSSGDHHRSVPIHQQVQHESGLLYRVGALRDDRPARPLVDATLDLRRELDEVVDRKLATRSLAERDRRHLGNLGYLRHVRDQRLPGQRRLYAFPPESVEEMVPPREKTATRGSAKAPPPVPTSPLVRQNINRAGAPETVQVRPRARRHSG